MKVVRDLPAAKLEVLGPDVPGQFHSTKKENKEKFTQADLPQETLKRWKEFLIPAWCDLAGTMGNPC